MKNADVGLLCAADNKQNAELVGSERKMGEWNENIWGLVGKD